jgi:hypothetical protein
MFLRGIKMAKKVYWINPNHLFPKHPPYQRLYKEGEQNDLTEVGMESYLQILPSIALYGFKYAIEINKSHAILNGDFRTFAARELGIKVPVVFSRLTGGRTILTYILIRRLRRIFKKQSLFFKRYENPSFRFDKVPLLCLFQKSLFGKVYPNRTDIIYLERKRLSFKDKVRNIINYYLRRDLL